MENLTNERKINLQRIQQARTEIGNALNNGFITENDIIEILKKDVNYGVKTFYSSISPKVKMLKNIFNCPFLLCDQENLSFEMKSLLPYFLNARYETEKDILEYYLKECYIDDAQYKHQLEELKFNYYETSNDGRNIFETGHVVMPNKGAKKIYLSSGKKIKV